MGMNLSVFLSSKWQRWQGEKIMPRSEFMFRRQTNSSHVSRSRVWKYSRRGRRASVYTDTRVHVDI